MSPTIAVILLGSALLAYLVYRIQAVVVRGLINGAYKRGYDKAREEGAQVIYQLDREVLKYKAKIPAMGSWAWCIDFNEKSMKLVKVLSKDEFDSYTYKGIDDVYPLTGVEGIITILMPDSAQEC